VVEDIWQTKGAVYREGRTSLSAHLIDWREARGACQWVDTHAANAVPYGTDVMDCDVCLLVGKGTCLWR
jgi:hypothetical protein